MADNVTFQDASLATPADGTVVSTDEAASGHVQRMKLTYSGNGLDTHVPADADGLLVNLGANNDVTVTGAVTATLAAGTEVKITDGTDDVAVTTEGNLQTITPNRTATGTINADEEAVTISSEGAASVSFVVTASDLAADVMFEATPDGATWVPVQYWAYNVLNNAGAADTLDVGDIKVVPAQPFTSVRVRIDAYTSGSATVTAVANIGPPSLNSVNLFSNTGSPIPGDEVDGLLVNLGANNDVTVAGVATAANQLPDGHNVAVASLPNEGQQTMANSISVAVASNQSAVPVSGTVAVTGVSTLAEQQSQTTHLATIAGDTTDIETAVELIDDSVATLGTTTYAEATTKGLIVGALRRDADTSAVNTDNEIAPLVVDATGKLKVEVFDGGDSHTVDQATAANLNAQVVGNIAHDTAHTGNPVTVSGTHETIADSAPANRLASVTDGDVQRLSTTDGALFVIPTGPQSWKARLTGSMSDTTVKAAPSSGLSLYITDIVYSIGSASASSILLEESTTTAVFGPHYLEAIAGRGLAVHLGTPIKITAATLLSATSTGSTTNTLDVYGFTAPG